MMSANKQEQLIEEIIAFVSDELCIESKYLHLNSRLFHDLGIDGVDAYDLLDKYSLKYNVNLGEFPHHDYFNVEMGVSFIAILKRFIGRADMPNKKEISIHDLVEGVESGVLKPNN
jgi:acyl carrier protein